MPCAARSSTREVSLTFSSLRADTLTPGDDFSALESSRAQAVAHRPEAGSERLRRVINKNLSEETVIPGRRNSHPEEGSSTSSSIFHDRAPLRDPGATSRQFVGYRQGDSAPTSSARAGARSRLATITLSVNSFVLKPSLRPFSGRPSRGFAKTERKGEMDFQKALHRGPERARSIRSAEMVLCPGAPIEEATGRVSAPRLKVAWKDFTWSRAMRADPPQFRFLGHARAGCG